MTDLEISLTWPIVSLDPEIQAHYEFCRAEGTSHNLAEMFALRQPPMSKSDREFLHGHHNGNQFEKSPHIGDYYKSVADAQGVDVTGAIYLNGLAAYPGDPKAWVRGRGDVQKVCEERGWNARGMVEVKAPQRDTAPVPAPLGEDVVNAKVDEICAGREDGAEIDRADLAEQVREKIKPYWKTSDAAT